MLPAMTAASTAHTPALTVDVIFEIQKGEPVSFERINIRGNSKTRDKVIRRELRIIEGEQFSQSLIDYSKRRVTALGYFEKVEITTKRGGTDSQMEANVEVSERPTGTFQIGAGFSSVENFIAQRVSGIVLAPLDRKGLVAPVETAVRGKIPVVIIDSGLESKAPASSVSIS